MTEIENLNRPEYLAAVSAVLSYKAPAKPISEDYTDPSCYNLIEEATAECLNGECDHFCGEPTQFDLERLEKRGLTEIVDAYESKLAFA